MAKKNFDDFVMAAGKRKKPSPEEVDELSKILHPAEPTVAVQAPPAGETPQKVAKKRAVSPKKAAEKQPAEPKPVPAAQKTATKQPARRIVGKEKVRITVDLEKDLYQKLKMRVVVEETDLSTFLRELLQKTLPK